MVEPVTTHISADAQKLYEYSFVAEQTQTAATQLGPQGRSRGELWRQLAPFSRYPLGYDPTIIRFYEDVITELQRELAKYKTMVVELLKTPPATEINLEYSTGERTVLPPDVADRLRAHTMPASPMIGHEI